MAATKNLEMIRGDTMTLDVELTDLEDATVASMFFTVKKKATDTTNVIQKSLSNGITNNGDNSYTVRVAPSDTSNVAAGKYAYDLQIGIGSDIFTVMMGILTVIQDVTAN